MFLRFGLVLGVVGGTCMLAACAHTVEGTGSSGSSSSGTSGTSGGTRECVPVDALKLCRLLQTSCEGSEPLTVEQCKGLNAFRGSPSCASQIASTSAVQASCADIELLVTTCLPPCTEGQADVCNSDGSVTTCRDGGLYTFDCDVFCASFGLSSSKCVDGLTLRLEDSCGCT